jgi:transcriptional regulator with XRE-family HTH domain
LGLSRRALADLSGIHHVTLWRIEAGRTLPNATTLAVVAKVLRVDPMQLVGEAPQGAAEGDR